MPKDDISLLSKFVVLKRSKRIQGKDRVEAILDEGKSRSNPFFVLRWLPGSGTEHRYACLVGKKLERSAVKRNRKRRQVYEIIRLMEKDGPLAKREASDIVILARRPAVTASFEELNQALRALLNEKA